MSHAEEEIRALLAAYETALNAADAGRIEQLYTEDGVFMPAGFPSASGRQAVHGAYDAKAERAFLQNSLRTPGAAVTASRQPRLRSSATRSRGRS